MKHKQNIIPDEVVLSKNLPDSGKEGELDVDLAEFYDVHTKQLKRSVRRNLIRFSDDLMFELSKAEVDNLRCQFGTSSWGGTRYVPMAFTEQSVAMLSSILNSERAILVNIHQYPYYSGLYEDS
jgi:hypothetical protein